MTFIRSRLSFISMVLLVSLSLGLTSRPALGAQDSSSLRTVFLIVMENHDWSEIKGNRDAHYINHTLLPMSSYATRYYNPPNNHPSLPNYLWLEGGTNFGITDDADPPAHLIHSGAHLVTLLDKVHVSWRAYEESIDGRSCPINTTGEYAAKHDPFVYFSNVVSPRKYCIAHVRPFTQLASDLRMNTVARYNFITPNLCDDMHDSCAPLNNQVKQGDTWLAHTVPPILRSGAYRHGGVLFITWDEGEGDDGPIGLIVLSPDSRGHGFHNATHYTHSSLLRTIEEIFRVHPLLGGADHAIDLRALFRRFP